MAVPLLTGIASMFGAARRLLRVPRLRRLAMAPMAINVAVLLIGLPLLVWGGVEWTGSIVTGGGTIGRGVRVAAQVVAALLSAAIGIIVLLLLARAIAAPFVTRLSDAVEENLLGDGYRPRESSLRTDAVDMVRSISFALGRLALFLLFYPPILLLQLIPAVGLILSLVLSFLYTAFVLSLDFSEPVFERHLPGFRARVAFVVRHGWHYLGFGGVAAGIALIPFANLLLLPVSVAAATRLYFSIGDGRNERE